MLVEALPRRDASAHVIVLGNEKGGSGKSTTAMHVTVALMNVGQRVATIDLDSRQKSFTHYIENRRAWAKRARVELKAPAHFWVARGSTLKLDENEAIEFSGFAERWIYREFFPRGLTALDKLDEATLGTRPSLSHVTARAEVMSLIEALKLPLDARGQRRAAARAEWFASVEKPLEVADILQD